MFLARTTKAQPIEEIRRGWWKELLILNEEIRWLQYQVHWQPFNSLFCDTLRAQIWKLRHKLYVLAERLGLNDAAAELPFKRTCDKKLPEIPDWLLHREVV